MLYRFQLLTIHVSANVVYWWDVKSAKLGPGKPRFENARKVKRWPSTLTLSQSYLPTNTVVRIRAEGTVTYTALNSLEEQYGTNVINIFSIFHTTVDYQSQTHALARILERRNYTKQKAAKNTEMKLAVGLCHMLLFNNAGPCFDPAHPLCMQKSPCLIMRMSS